MYKDVFLLMSVLFSFHVCIYINAYTELYTHSKFVLHLYMRWVEQKQNQKTPHETLHVHICLYAFDLGRLQSLVVVFAGLEWMWCKVDFMDSV